MGFVVSKMWSKLFGLGDFKVCILGLDNAGKTTLLYKLVLDDVVQTHPTLGSNVEEFTYKNVRFLLWDLGGQDSLRANWKTYYTNTKAVILVIDSTDVDRIDILRQELQRLVEEEDLQRASLLIYANKQDVKGALRAEEITKELKLTNLKDRPWFIKDCCALTGEGVFEGMDWLAHQLSQRS